ncbi:MAG: tRNA (guanosine(37)-N1)-methyltransferase TrmD [Actinomycetota bacterium]|nr:tRNA (guanosine(37)-N1)-methyltransferase TrmD [Actinomycetota bacterium]
MRVDVISIFPDYLAPLGQSLLGRAADSGLVELRIHDLRAWTSDRHRTVDDTPYGGGAGMVMKAEPWGEALDDLLTPYPAPDDRAPRLIVPSPAGKPFTQADAERLGQESRLIFACGRYEGIDQRVLDHFAQRVPIEEISIGDFVLNGGEVAALVIIEAVARLIPGFMGNAESLAEESHHTGAAGGLLEYPVYTKPSTWRDLEVPAILRSGNHAKIAAWRRDQARRRTAKRRPDLLHPSQTVRVEDLMSDTSRDEGAVVVRIATAGDAAELLTLQRACWVQEAQLNDALSLPPLVESLDDVRAGIGAWLTWVVRTDRRLVGSVRAGLRGETWQLGRLMVAPDLQGRGIGRWLLGLAESAAPEEATRLEVFTGAASVANLRMYKRAGYRPMREAFVDAEGREDPGVVRLAKART